MSMSGQRIIIKIIKDKFESKQYDYVKYYETLNNTMERVHNSMTSKNNAGDLFPLDSFCSACWSKLEDGKLSARLYYSEFANDAKIIAFLKKTFENLFLEGLDLLNPGFRSRKKQVQRVLNPLCLENYRKKFKQWKLKTFKDDNIEPAPVERLMDASETISQPRVTYSRTEDSVRGPRIKDADMKLFLVSVLENGGGATRFKDMDRFIHVKFGLEPITKIDVYAHPEGEEKSYDSTISEMAHDEKTIMSGSDHHVMAAELFTNMQSKFKDLIYYRYVQDMKQEEYAAIIGKSTGTVSKIEKETGAFLHDYVHGNRQEQVNGKRYSISAKEFQIVFALLKNLIDNNRQAVS